MIKGDPSVKCDQHDMCDEKTSAWLRLAQRSSVLKSDFDPDWHIEA